MGKTYFNSRMWMAVGLALLSVKAPADAAAPGQHASQVFKLDIKSQPIADALNEFAKQSGIQIMFFAEVTQDLRAPAIAGDFTAQDALLQMLAHTGLAFTYVNDRTVMVSRDPATSESRSAGSEPAMRLARLSGDPGAPFESGRASENRGERKGGRIEEIIVTAQKRAERLQDVPVSIAAVSADEIDRRGLVGEEDYLRGVPGTNQVSQATGTAIMIRGIETSPQSQNFASGPTVATYFGETPTTNSGGLTGGSNVDVKLVDIERIEVLRGPQGTAFGNSSLGGAVRTLPAAPKLGQWAAKAGASYSVTSGHGGSNNMIRGMANVPLARDRLAVRAVGYRFDDSGIYDNVAGSDAALQAAAAVYGAQAFATNDDDVGASNVTGGRIAALFQATDDFKITLSYLSQKTEVDGQSQAGGQSYPAAYDQAILQIAPEHVRRGQKGGLFDTDIDLANATLDYNFGWANLLATFSHVRSGSVYAVPQIPQPWSQLGDSDHREKSGEIRLTTQLDGAWNFLVGLYAEKLEDEAYTTYQWFGTTASLPRSFGTNPFLGDYLDQRELTQKAGFAEISWEPFGGLTLTGGVRAYEYDRTAWLDTSGSLFNPTAPTSIVSTRTEADASGTSLRGNVSYKFNDNAMVYAGWSQGFRLGKPQVALPAGRCDIDGNGILDGSNGITLASTGEVGSDEVDNYELGAKFTLLDGRLILAGDVYRIDWSGVPIRVAAPGTVGSTNGSGCGLTYIANGGEARSEGVELQANFYVTSALRLDVGGSTVDAELTKNAPALSPPAFAGDRLPGSPKVNANLGLQYEFEVGGYEAFVRTDSIYVGTFYGNLQEQPITKAGGYVKVDASARIAVKNLSIDLFVRNLTDADDYTWRGTSNASRGNYFGYRLRPRTIGVQLEYAF